MALPPSANLKGHWKMNDNANDNIVVDSTGVNNGISVQNTDQVDVVGKIHGALTFNGSSDYVNCFDKASLLIMGAITLAAWVKTTDLDSAEKLIVGWHRTGFADGWFLEKWGNTAWFWYGGSPPDRVDSGVVINDGIWHHIVGVYDGGIVKDVYVDGIWRATQGCSGNTGAAKAHITIGAILVDYHVAFFPGDIDDVRIYNMALTQDQIDSIYNGGNGTEYDASSSPLPSFFRP